MRRSTRALIALASAVALGSITALSLVTPARVLPAQVAPTEVASAQATHRDIEARLAEQKTRVAGKRNSTPDPASPATAGGAARKDF